MAAYVYDDFEIDFAPGDGGSYGVSARCPDGTARRGTFSVPLSEQTLEQTVVHLASARSRSVHAATREIAAADQNSSAVDAEMLGGALATALFAGDIGAAYDSARNGAAAAQHGLRLTLSLAATPALLSLPWEFLYRPPRFIASQRHTPLVRRLRCGEFTAPPAITDTVHILGVISSPGDLPALDVASERARVETAVHKMVAAGRVQLDWLEPATPRKLREALRDSSYHILHYVGHSSFTAASEGAIYLEDDNGSAAEVDNTVLANLLADQSTLRLVVLNSCEGARTTLSDPYAGVATTLIQLGVPAVVAMQFEITDKAAILFADELYTNLIGRQDPIDAAVSEARKAIYVELDRVEWATPVLFVRDPDVQLFDFKVPVAPLPPPPRRDEPELGEPEARAVADVRRPPVRRRPPKLVLGSAAAAIALALAGTAVVVSRGGDGSATSTVAPTAPSTPVPAVVAPRERQGLLAVQVLEADGDTHWDALNLGTNQLEPALSDRSGVTDTQGVWDRRSNRFAFTRQRPSLGVGTSLVYVVPGHPPADKGVQVTALIPWTPGEFDHAPAWTADGALLYARTAGCRPGPNCAEELRRAEFAASNDGKGFADKLTVTSDQTLIPRFGQITAVIADPVDANRSVVADEHGLWLVDGGQAPRLFAPTTMPRSIAYTPDGSAIVTVVVDRADTTFTTYSPTGDVVASGPLKTPDAAAAANLRQLEWMSITPDESGRGFIGLNILPDHPTVAVLSRLQLFDDGSIGVVGVIPFNGLVDLGQAQAVAL